MLSSEEKRALAESLKDGTLWIDEGAETRWHDGGQRLSPGAVVAERRSSDSILGFTNFTGASARAFAPAKFLQMAVSDVAEYLGYADGPELLKAFRDPESALLRLRNRLESDGFPGTGR